MSMYEEYRCVLKFKIFNFFIATDYNGNMFKVVKNKHLWGKSGDDITFYAKRKSGILFDKLTPVSDKEAGYIH